MRGQVRPRSPRDGSTAPARRPSSVRWPAPPSPPSEASSRPAATARARCAPRAKNRSDACVRALQPPRAPPRAAAAAFARSQPSLHLTYDAPRLIRAALAVVSAVDTSPTRRRWALRRALRVGLRSRCSAHVPPQARAGGRGGRQCVQGREWRAQSAYDRGGRPWRGRWVGRRRPPLVPIWGCPRRPSSDARLRQFGRRGGSKAAQIGAGLAWGWWQVALGPARAVRAPVRPRFGRPRASDR
jgi:hypothetical protein